VRVVMVVDMSAVMGARRVRSFTRLCIRPINCCGGSAVDVVGGVDLEQFLVIGLVGECVVWFRRVVVVLLYCAEVGVFVMGGGYEVQCRKGFMD
jgi:hypothetical protein